MRVYTETRKLNVSEYICAHIFDWKIESYKGEQFNRRLNVPLH
jgi:hypothetical protein